jgi:microsomal epoxide hydrolase
VAPSLPGYGFSGPTAQRGWGTRRITDAMAALMARLGFGSYGAHGGDWGAAIARELGVVDRAHVVGVHLTMLLGAVPSRDDADPEVPAERRSRELLGRYRGELSGYAILQSTRPQTLGYALTDSPVGQLAWIAEKFKDWTDSETAPEDAVDRDRLLTNVTLYWLTRTAGSSARLRTPPGAGAPRSRRRARRPAWRCFRETWRCRFAGSRSEPTRSSAGPRCRSADTFPRWRHRSC